MIVQLRESDSDLLIPIPKTACQKLGWTRGTKVRLETEAGRLIISRAGAVRCRLEELVAGIRRENRHGAVDWGPPTGKESW